MPNTKLVYASAVKDLLMGLDELPWEENVDDLVDSLPTVEVKQGQWEILGRAVIDTIGKCTECDGEAVWRTRNNPYAICPNCGAHMNGVK